MTSLKLPERLTIENAFAVKADLLVAVQGDGDLLLDGTAVREVDLAGLQLLCAAARSAAFASKSLRFAPAKRSPAVDAAARAAGFIASDTPDTELEWPQQRSARG